MQSNIPLLPLAIAITEKEKAIEEAKENTSKGIEFERRLVEARSEVNRAKMEGKLDATLFAVFGLTQTAANLPDAYLNPSNQQRLTLGITVPLVDWGMAKGQLKMAESIEEWKKTTIEQEQIDFDQNISLKIMRFALQEHQILIAAKSDTVAQKSYDVIQRRYMIGKVNDVRELNLAQIDNDNAKKDYYSALRNYWLNYYEIRKLTLYNFIDNRKINLD